MARKCEICGKGPMFGNSISHAHNVSKRVFYPNVHKMKIIDKNGDTASKFVCTKCLKKGKVAKA